MIGLSDDEDSREEESSCFGSIPSFASEEFEVIRTMQSRS